MVSVDVKHHVYLLTCRLLTAADGRVAGDVITGGVKRLREGRDGRVVWCVIQRFREAPQVRPFTAEWYDDVLERFCKVHQVRTVMAECFDNVIAWWREAPQ